MNGKVESHVLTQVRGRAVQMEDQPCKGPGAEGTQGTAGGCEQGKDREMRLDHLWSFGNFPNEQFLF